MSQAAKKVRAHGIGVHKPEEIEEFGHNDLMVLSDLLGDKPFFFGDAPTSVRHFLFAAHWVSWRGLSYAPPPCPADMFPELIFLPLVTESYPEVVL